MVRIIEIGCTVITTTCMVLAMRKLYELDKRLSAVEHELGMVAGTRAVADADARARWGPNSRLSIV
jgi:hypothetical protein